jgi:glucose/mannose-6-phosphate isomerase
MHQLIADFPKEILHAIEIGNSAIHTGSKTPIREVIISGLGGSGIGGSLVSSLLSDSLSVPVIVNKGYFLPAFTGPQSLVVISSYSGNTEETLHALEMAMQRKAKIVCITSGGRVAAMAQANNLDLIIIPSGRPPRASLGYSLTQLLFVFAYHGIAGKHAVDELKTAANFLTSHQEEIKKQCFALAELLKDQRPVLYSDDKLEPVAIRWKQQLNENAKMLCWHNVYPELNHNELVGWRNSEPKISLIFLLHGDEFERIKLRMKLNEQVFRQHTDHIHHIEAMGHNFMEKVMYLIHFGDWLSYYLAEMRGYDPMEIDVLNQLKDDLSKAL